MEHAGWPPPDSDLLAYLMDDLEGARAEYLAVHLRHCPHCRTRLDELRETLGLLQTLTPPNPDNHLHRAALKARIADAAASNAAPARSAGWRFAPAGVAFAALLVLVIVSGPMIARAGVVSLNDILRVVPGLGDRDNMPQVIPDDYGGPPGERLGLPAGPTLDPAALPFVPLVPPVLPGENQLTATVATPDGRFHAIYNGDDGLELLVVQQPAAGVTIQSADEGVAEQIDGIDVIIYQIPQIGVARLTWAQHDVLFTVDAITMIPDAFSLAEARALVSALIHFQDSALGPTR